MTCWVLYIPGTCLIQIRYFSGAYPALAWYTLDAYRDQGAGTFSHLFQESDADRSVVNVFSNIKINKYLAESESACSENIYRVQKPLTFLIFQG